MPTQPEREEFFKRELAEELRRVEALVRGAPTLDKKTYYFSAAYGITNRSYRYSFSKDILVADLLLSGVYNMIMERIAAIRAGDQNVVPDQLVFDKICDGLRDLANNIESGESIFEPLKTIVGAGFALTGAGNYLREKGLLEP